MAIRRSLAKRYSKALIATAVADMDLDILAKDIKGLSDAFVTFPDLRESLESPTVQIKAKLGIMRELNEKLSTGKTVRRLADLLVESHRAEYLPAITETFLEEVDRKRGVLRGEVLSTGIVDAVGLARVQVALSKAFGNKKIVLSQKADPSLIGGLQVRVGGVLIDGSLKGRLETLVETMNKA
jgi:F-type H+-transporting ATPase subunit delta